MDTKELITLANELGMACIVRKNVVYVMGEKEILAFCESDLIKEESNQWLQRKKR